MHDVLTVRALEISPVLVVMVGARACAFPLHHVSETMRPLPIEPVAGTPGFVRGVSVIRGVPTPVVDLKALLEICENSPSYGRFVALKCDARRVVIGVDSVVGLRNLASAQLGELPPLLRDVTTDLIESFGPGLGRSLAQEWHLIDVPLHATVASIEGRRLFLKQLLFSSPASMVLGLSERIADEIRSMN